MPTWLNAAELPKRLNPVLGVKDKLKALHLELDAGIRSSPSYTMALCIEDWLSQGLAARSPSTVANHRHLASHAVAKIGAVKLQDLIARHVQVALTELSGSLSRGRCAWCTR